MLYKIVSYCLVVAMVSISFGYATPQQALAEYSGDTPNFARYGGAIAGGLLMAVLSFQFGPLGIIAGTVLGGFNGFVIGGVLGAMSGSGDGFGDIAGALLGMTLGLLGGTLVGGLVAASFAPFGIIAGGLIGAWLGRYLIGQAYGEEGEEIPNPLVWYAGLWRQILGADDKDEDSSLAAEKSLKVLKDKLRAAELRLKEALHSGSQREQRESHTIWQSSKTQFDKARQRAIAH